MKTVAKTLKALAGSDTLAILSDRSRPIRDVVDTLIDHWGYDLPTRRPKPALLENGVLTPTDLDLACFMSGLADRGAVINLPRYESRRPKVQREGEHIVSAANRHGKVSALVANKDVFSFSVRVFDVNVIKAGDESLPIGHPQREDSVGAWRSFMLVDINGEWHDGWSCIEFLPSAKENAFLSDKGLWTDNKVYFKNFIHPNRWTSFYGQYYFLSKAAIERMTEESKFLRTEVDRLLDAGIMFPTAKVPSPKTSAAGPSEKEEVEAFEAEVDFPKVGEFQTLPNTTESLLYADETARLMTYTLIPKLRFAVRATELAFRNHIKGKKEMPFPGWISGAEWDSDYKVSPKSRTLWSRLVLHQTWPGVKGLALRFRTYKKTEPVAG